MNTIVQSIVDEILIGEDEDLSPPPEPVSAAAQVAAQRRADALRKRDERASRRGAGFPDSRSVDHAIAQALAGVLQSRNAGAMVAQSGTLEGMKVMLRPIVVRAVHALIQKDIDPEIARRVVQARLLKTGG